METNDLPPIAVFDLDGVIFKSPSPTIIHDLTFWLEYWADSERQRPNPEMVKLLHDVSTFSPIVILTARPISAARDTTMALANVGVLVTSNLTTRWHSGIPTGIHLIMWPLKPDWDAIPHWKQKTVDDLNRMQGVSFVVEDHKVNADLIRRICPVLLYEAYRGYSS